MIDIQLSKFVKFINERSFKEALDYSKKVFTPYLKRGLYLRKLDDHFLFFAFKNPENCPNSHLLDDKVLKELCIRINREINKGKGKQPHLFFYQILPLSTNSKSLNGTRRSSRETWTSLSSTTPTKLNSRSKKLHRKKSSWRFKNSKI